MLTNLELSDKGSGIIFYYTNPNKMRKLHSLFYLTTALHVSGIIITHLKEHKTTVTTVSGNRYTVLLSATIVEELELIWVCCGWLLWKSWKSSNSSMIANHNTLKSVPTLPW